LVSIRERDWSGSQKADQAPLSARVAIDVAFGRLDGSMSREQLDVAQAAAAAVDVPRGGGDEGSSVEVRRASLKAELSEQRREPIDHAGRAQTAATGGADDRPEGFAYPQQASKRVAQVGMHGDAATATLLGDRVVDRKNVCDLAASVEHHRPFESGHLAGAQSRFDRQQDHHSITAGNGAIEVLRNIWGVTTLACLPGMMRNSLGLRPP
jgi:hypothetical protein